MDKYIKRYLDAPVKADIKKKMVFLAGPRQCGKTTFAHHLPGPGAPVPYTGADAHYWNWDDPADRENILRERYPEVRGYFIFDEIHKYRNWRQYLKGLYDKQGKRMNILVTGSARLDYYRRGGDSLQGRYHFYRLHPFSLKEVGPGTFRDMEDLLHFGGFPEPFLAASEKETRRWSRAYRSRLVTEDVTGLEQVKEISLMEKMALRLPDLVGSPLSVNALREDLQASHQTVSRWIDILERIYALFRIYPFGGPRVRAVKKEAKHYHYDWTQVEDPAARFENLVACHLLKWCHYLEDTEGLNMELRYFRDIDRREVDFVVVRENKPVHFIECKTKDTSVSVPLRYLKRKYPKVLATQVCLKKDINVRNRDDIRICNARYLLNELV